MKNIFHALALVALVALTLARASAQVVVELDMNQEQFLPGEALPVAVKITNQSGRQLHFGAAGDWLTFSVESVDGFVVNRKAELLVQGEFELESSQMGTKHVDIAPGFIISKPGRYKVTATLRNKDLSAPVTSPAKTFDVITGAKLWNQEFGLPATNGLPEMRKFSLEQASYLRAQMRLYVQVSDATESRIFTTVALGASVSFSRPEAQVDRTSRLHVLWQSGAQSFSYCTVSPDGEILSRDTYDDFDSRPRLRVNDSGDVVIIGGLKRPKPAAIPAIPPPAEAVPGK